MTAKQQKVTKPEDPAISPPPGLSEAAKRWIKENRDAIRSSNEYVEKHGLPLAKHRAFKWQD